MLKCCSVVVAVAVGVLGCGSRGGVDARAGDKDTAVVFVAASLNNAFRAEFDSFTARTGTIVLTESGASVEHARKITDLGRVPDLIVLADEDIFPKLLAPKHLTWWATFARNRMVVAFTDRSRLHDSITADNWYEIVTRRGVEVGRSDPKIAPVGYHALELFKLAERQYGKAGLGERLLASAPPKNIRANAADLAALLAAGELDYIYDYESVARANGFRFVPLPDDIQGTPVRYALSIPLRAPHPRAALAVTEDVLSDGARSRFRAAHIDMLDSIDVKGTQVPASLTPARR
jgi:molybdate/tungstate transport system substrate-binding protein